MPIAKPSPNPNHINSITYQLSIKDLERVSEGLMGQFISHPSPPSHEAPEINITKTIRI
jgi:hypothetical protein